MKWIAESLDEVGIEAILEIRNDYEFMTKGEMLLKCSDQKLLRTLLPNTTSCGRYGVYERTHCGRCVPCLVRRAAFIRAGMEDSTSLSLITRKQYVLDDLKAAVMEKSSRDIMAVASASHFVRKHGIKRFVGGAFTFADSNEVKMYESVVERGLKEIEEFLKSHGVM